jgi:hypothetical protein
MMKKGESEFTIVLIACLLGIVASGLWWRRETRKKQELSVIYAFACEGDRTYFNKLRELKPSESTPQLEHMALAREQDCSGETRIAAIGVLSSRGLPNKDALTSLLGIDHPFGVRHAAVEALIQHGCDGLCVESALEALKALSRGQPASETKAEADVETMLIESAPSTEDLKRLEKSRQDLKELRQQAQNDYFKLLQNNPCEAQKILRTKYSTDHELIDSVQKKVPGC